MTDEPTTGEIVQELRYCADVNSICGDACPAHIVASGCRTVLMQSAADRLESQERTIAELTARAESAEVERDAAKADMKLIADAVREKHCDNTCCFACKFDCDMSTNDSGEFENECQGFDRDDCFEWRGLPQDGEGK